MKKKFLLALLSFVMILSATLGFVACGDDNVVSGSLDYRADANYTYAYVYGPQSKMLQKAEIASEYEFEKEDGTKVTLPVTEIRQGAFMECVALQEVVIPETVTKISSGTFLGCVNLEKITVAEDNTSFETIDGSLYTEDGSKLIQYAIGKDAKSFTVPAEVKTIADHAFSGTKKLAELVIPETVETLGLGMLYAASVESITLPFVADKKVEPTNETMKYFYKKSLEEDPVMPTTLTKITINGTYVGDSALDGCAQIKEIAIGKDVSEINVAGFLACEKLEKFVVAQENETYQSIENNLYSKDGSTFYRYAIGNKAATFVLPKEVTKIEDGALSGCSYVAQITVEDGNQNYKDVDGNLYSKDGKTLIQYAIANTATTFAVPEGVETISAYAFANSETLAQITIPTTVTTVEEGAFSGVSKLSSIVIPNSVTYIGANVFEGCSALKEISVPFVGQTRDGAEDNVLTYFFAGQVSNSLTTVNITNALFVGANAFLNLKQLTTVTFNEGLVEIGADAFNACSNITEITFPGTLVTIGSGAFKACESIESVAIPNNVTEIGKEAFFGCASVKTITLGESISSIGASAFNGCVGVSEIAIPASVTEIGDLAFFGATKLSKIDVADANEYYEDVDGNLYTKDGSILMQYAAGKTVTEFTVSSQVKEIKANAFYSAIFLTKITVPATVEKIGKDAFAGCNGLTEVTLPFAGTSLKAIATTAWLRETFGTLPQGLKKVEITNQPKIAVTAFADCTSIETIVLSSVVEEVGNAAFRGCTNLKSITTSGLKVIGDRVFQGCTALTELDLTSAVSIGTGAFENCTALKTLKFGANLTTLSAKFNTGCTALTTITIDENNENMRVVSNAIYQGTSLIGYALANSASSLAIIEGTTKIEVSALENAKALKNVTIPNSVTEICENAFAGLDIESISIPATIIGKNAFANCSSLKNVTLSNTQVIGENAFSGCSKITSITIPETVTEIGTFAFSGCSSLKNVTVPSSLEVIGSNIFRLCNKLNYTTYQNAEYVGNAENPYLILVKATSTKISSITINENTKFISELAFMDCAKIASVTIPSSVKVIGAGAFMNCSALVNVTIEDGVEEIGASAFYNCDKIVDIIVPNSVKTIGKYAFSGCDSLEYLAIGDGVTTLGAGFVVGCKALNTISLNVTSGWKYYDLNTKDTNGDGILDEFDGYQTTGKAVSSSSLSAANIVKTLTETHKARLIKR